eukprot:375534-Rhodomonas_salina.1
MSVPGIMQQVRRVRLTGTCADITNSFLPPLLCRRLLCQHRAWRGRHLGRPGRRACLSVCRLQGPPANLQAFMLIDLCERKAVSW